MGLSYKEFVDGHRKVHQEGAERAGQTVRDLTDSGYMLLRVYVQSSGGVMSEQEFNDRHISDIPGEVVVAPFLVPGRLIDEPNSAPRLSKACLLGAALFVGPVVGNASVDRLE